MKKNQLIVTLLILISTPFLASAHGGTEKAAGSVRVVLVQQPLSPLVGEPVRFTFVLSDNQNQQLQDREVKLKLIDTFFGDASKDTVAAEQTMKTDVNGSFEFTYQFNKANYYDIELEMIDPVDNSPQETGFLIQVREAVATEKPNDKNLQLIGSAVALLIVGFFIGRLFGRSSNLS